MTKAGGALQTAVIPSALAAMPLVVLVAAGAVAGACSPVVPPIGATDAGDEAWVKQAVQALAGRKPEGMREVLALVDMVKKSDRATVARGLTKLPEFVDLWADRLYDDVYAARDADSPEHTSCYGGRARSDDGGEVAAFIRDHSPADSMPAPAPTLVDVIRSSLELDDLSPFYRAQLFTTMVRAPPYCINPSPVQMDLTRRRTYGARFTLTYLNRDVVCLGCHNSAFSVTALSNPALNPFWPIPGHFERSLFGSDEGRPEDDVYGPFRYLGFVSKASVEAPDELPGYPDDVVRPVRPWGLSGSCGQFLPPSAIADDPASGIDAWFGQALGPRSSVWTIEAALHQGVDELRGQSEPTLNATEALASESLRAFAYLLAERIASQAWEAVYGYPLVIGNYFPRNQPQRDRLQALTGAFLANGWSLRELLVRIVTDPLFNAPSPSALPAGATPYALDAVFNPYSIEETDPSTRLNSAGDRLHRELPRAQIRMAAHAEGWIVPSPLQSADADTMFTNLGAFYDDTQLEQTSPDYLSIMSWRWFMSQSGYATHELQPAFSGRNWLSLLVRFASSTHGVTVRDVAAALKDRMITEPDIDAEEEQLLAKVYGVPSLDVPVSSLDPGALSSAVSSHFNALIRSRQFNLVGAPPPDQRSLARIAMRDSTYLGRCQALAPLIFDASTWTVTCHEESIDVAPAGAAAP